MARKYSRDNRGRFAGGGGATARGGRLRTAAGNKRKTQTMESAAKPKGTIGKPKGLKPGTIKAKAVAVKTEKVNSTGLTKKQYEKQYAAMAAKQGITLAGSKVKSKSPSADDQLSKLATRSNNLTRSKAGLSKAEAIKAADLGRATGRRVEVTQGAFGGYSLRVGSAKPAAKTIAKSGIGKAPLSKLQFKSSDAYKYNKSGYLASSADRNKMYGNDRAREKTAALKSKANAGSLKASRKAARQLENANGYLTTEGSSRSNAAKNAVARQSARVSANASRSLGASREMAQLNNKMSAIKTKADARKASGKSPTQAMKSSYETAAKNYNKILKSQEIAKKASNVLTQRQKRITGATRERYR